MGGKGGGVREIPKIREANVGNLVFSGKGARALKGWRKGEEGSSDEIERRPVWESTFFTRKL